MAEFQHVFEEAQKQLSVDHQEALFALDPQQIGPASKIAESAECLLNSH